MSPVRGTRSNAQLKGHFGTLTSVNGRPRQCVLFFGEFHDCASLGPVAGVWLLAPVLLEVPTFAVEG